MPRQGKTGEVAEEYCRQHPEMSTRALAILMHKERPRLFRLYDSARAAIRTYRGERRGKFHCASEEKVTPTTYQYPAHPPKTDAVPWVPHYIPAGLKCTLVLSDVHIPYHDEKAIETAIRHSKEHHDIDNILYLGDLADCYQLSRFVKDPEARRFSEEIQLVRDMLDYVRGQFPKVKHTVFKCGNHEQRYEDYLKTRASELFGTNEFALKVLYGLHDKGISWVDSIVPIRIGYLWLLHGHELGRGIASPVNPARGAFLRANDILLEGHYHRSSHHSDTMLRGQILSCWSIGCLCHSSDTDVLTDKGWVTFPNLTPDHHVAEFDRYSKAIVHRKPLSIQRLPYSGDMLELSGRRINQKITPEHKVLYSRSDTQLRTAAASHVSELDRPHIPVCGFSEMTDQVTIEQAKLIAWIVTEGSAERTPGAERVSIYQTDLVGCKKIVGLLERLSLVFSESTDGRNGNRRFRLNAQSSRQVLAWMTEGHKRLPRALLNSSRRVLDACYEVLIAADGHRNRKGTDYFATISPELAGDFQEVCVKTGKSALVNEVIRDTKFKRNASIVMCPVRKFAQAEVRKSRKVPYRGMVYDVTTSTGYFVIRRGGCVSISGNCDLHPQYSVINKWNHGFAVVNRKDAEGNFTVENYKIINRKQVVNA